MVTSLVAGRMQIPKDTLVKASMVFTGIGALCAVFHPIGLTLMGAGSGLGMVGLVTGVSYLNINKGLAMGIFNTFTYAGLALVPILGGLLVPIIGYSSVFIINGILLIIMVLLPMSALSQANSIK
jgi:MFS family permease